MRNGLHLTAWLSCQMKAELWMLTMLLLAYSAELGYGLLWLGLYYLADS